MNVTIAVCQVVASVNLRTGGPAVSVPALAERLEGTLKDLERLQTRQLEQLKLALENQLETVKRGRYEQRSQQINRVFDEYRQWVHDTLTTEPQPWIQVLAGVCHPSAAA